MLSTGQLNDLGIRLLELISGVMQIQKRELVREVPVVKWLSSYEMDTATWVQILNESDCISHSTNTLGKGMNPAILPPAMGK